MGVRKRKRKFTKIPLVDFSEPLVRGRQELEATKLQTPKHPTEAGLVRALRITRMYRCSQRYSTLVSSKHPDLTR